MESLLHGLSNMQALKHTRRKIMLRTVKNATIDINNKIPAIYISGDKNRPIVIMAHGIMGSKNEYLDTQARISEKLENLGIASLRIDFCGHGDSDRTMREFSLDTQIQDLRDSIHWSLDKKYTSFILLGISFGAPPALIVSSLYNQIVKKCVLVAPVTDYKKTFVEPTTSWGKENFGAQRIINGIRCGGLSLEDNYTLFPQVLTDMLLVDIPTFIMHSNLNVTIFHGDSDNMVPYATSQAMCNYGNNIRLITMDNTEHGLTEVGDEEFVSPISLGNLDRVVYELCHMGT